MNTFAWIGSDGDGASGCRTSRRGCLRSHGSQTPFVGGRWHGSSPRGVRAVPCPSAASFGAGRSRASTPGPVLAWGCCNTPGGELVGKRGSRRKREKCGRDEAVPWSSGVTQRRWWGAVDFRPDSANCLVLFLWFCLAASRARAERRRRISPPSAAVAMPFGGCQKHVCCLRQPCAFPRLRFAFHVMGIIYQIVNNMLSFFHVSSTYHFNRLKIVKLDYFL